MTRPSTVPRLTPVPRGLAALLTAVIGLGACAAPAPDPTVPDPIRPGLPAPLVTSASPTPESTAALADVQTAVDRVFAAGVAGDRPAWDAGIGALDAAFAVRSTVLFDNLRALRPARLRVRLTGAELRLPAARRAALGPGAQALQARVVWRLPGEQADASSTVWLTVVRGARAVRLVGTGDGAVLDSPAVPLWWLSPVTRVTRGSVTVLAGPDQDAARWVGLASRAAADAHRYLPRTLRAGWNGHLVVEVPGNDADLTAVLGAAPSAYATTAAVTRPEGPTNQAALRVVVNPVTAGDPDEELSTTLTHEAVHVATRSVGSAAPLWAVEGLAEYVALEAHAGQRDDELAVLRGAARPTRLPADAAFTAGGKDVTAAYTQAWLACRAVAEHRGSGDLGRFYAALGRGRTVEQAARSALGVHGRTLVGWWRAELRRAAAGGRG
jgi:hypothetical protein